MKTEHTVGPWKADIGVIKRNTICAVYPYLGSRPLRVDSVNGFVASEKEEQANARLIAAAPDGLKVAQDFVAWVDQLLTVRPMNQLLPGLQARYDEAKAFIAKATQS